MVMIRHMQLFEIFPEHFHIFIVKFEAASGFCVQSLFHLLFVGYLPSDPQPPWCGLNASSGRPRLHGPMIDPSVNLCSSKLFSAPHPVVNISDTVQLHGFLMWECTQVCMHFMFFTVCVTNYKMR